MQVILLETIHNLGGLGDRVNVKPGFARNFLVPQGKALTATKANIALFEERRAELEAKLAAEVKSAEGRAKQLEAISLRIERLVGDGRLFGSVSAPDIVEALAAQGAEVQRNEVRLPDGPIRQTGEFEIGVRVHPDVEAKIKLEVVGPPSDDDDDDDEFDDVADEEDTRPEDDE